MILVLATILSIPAAKNKYKKIHQSIEPLYPLWYTESNFNLGGRP